MIYLLDRPVTLKEGQSVPKAAACFSCNDCTFFEFADDFGDDKSAWTHGGWDSGELAADIHAAYDQVRIRSRVDNQRQTLSDPVTTVAHDQDHEYEGEKGNASMKESPSDLTSYPLYSLNASLNISLCIVIASYYTALIHLSTFLLTSSFFALPLFLF